MDLSTKTPGQVAMTAFWRNQAPPTTPLTKEEVAERWEEAARAVIAMKVEDGTREDERE